MLLTDISEIKSSGSSFSNTIIPVSDSFKAILIGINIYI